MSDLRRSGESVDGDATGPPDVTLSPDAAAHLDRLRALSHLFDASIRVPYTRARIGIDPILGLFPIVGNLPGTALAAYVVAVAVTADVPRATLFRILFVLGVDSVVGSVPVVGDVFDAYWKANLRSVRLVEDRLDAPAAAALDRRYLRRVAVVAFLAFLAVAVALAVAGLWLVGRFG
ncbi:DUF4112 domain-containing protein [Haloplanus sp. GCM10025708]|uniref:DUF4112 domain-containing protein n=1 Tax=Haloferacaceae TaxID=1644056 RepID=UPI00360D9C7B